MNLDVVLIFLALGVLVLNVEYAQDTIVPGGEQNLIIEGDSQSFNGKTVGLDLKDFLPGVAEDLD